jgi:hypothetical protein
MNVSSYKLRNTLCLDVLFNFYGIFCHIVAAVTVKLGVSDYVVPVADSM